ncbi:diguanylate cyclase domain-containing protein [Azohydromonas caseinilytica]|uniref:diguanylate cyclase n=1 Tax=Azohydromonas caseinilytica TaxID=2728836 RepID=A0A848FHB1_9BURK|nr:diguanylate cyclase [Azohydromonas caseinilytica]NML17231.1 diguanylate cyclase [Azohydromonas caseinilytica]
MPEEQRPVPALPCLLVVDDDPGSILLLSRVLEAEARIVFATSGEAALQQFQAHQPDLVLLDAHMPGLSGFDTCLRLKADPRSADVPVIFVTAFTDTETETHALDIGAVDFIHKPINPPVVRARVRTHLALKQKTDALRRLSVVDPLTGIANRRAFDDTLRKEWLRAMRHQHAISLLMIDIDHFKRYNDAHGHRAGDACLRQVAELIAGSTRRSGDLAARYGGEEFAVILPHAAAARAQAFAQRLCEAVRGRALPHGASPVGPCVTVSIGAATLRRPCETPAGCRAPCRDCPRFERCLAAPEHLVELADRALFQAKHDGRARVVAHENLIGGDAGSRARALDSAAP